MRPIVTRNYQDFHFSDSAIVTAEGTAASEEEGKSNKGEVAGQGKGKGARDARKGGRGRVAAGRRLLYSTSEKRRAITQ